MSKLHTKGWKITRMQLGKTMGNGMKLVVQITISTMGMKILVLVDQVQYRLLYALHHSQPFIFLQYRHSYTSTLEQYIPLRTGIILEQVDSLCHKAPQATCSMVLFPVDLYTNGTPFIKHWHEPMVTTLRTPHPSL